MKKTVWTFGLIAGGIMSLMMLLGLPFKDAIERAHAGYVIGYTTMVLSFLLTFFGVRSYRDNVLGGSIGFGRALTVGALITAVASMCYVATWEAIFFTIAPDYLTSYQTAAVNKLKASGASPEVIQKKIADDQKFAELYKNPLVNSAMTFLEPLPVGLVMALVAAGVLRRKSGRDGVLAPSIASS